jgi:hypothetical protein
MKQTILTVIALAASASAAAAQEPATYNGHAYGWLSTDRVGHSSSYVTTGAGAEGFVYRGLAVGADLGYLFPTKCPSGGVGLLSVNPAYHFVNRAHPSRFVPFVTAGYTLGFRSGTASMMNWGGGATYWFSQHAGVRVEVRDFRQRQERFDTALRFGVSFR